MNPPDRAQPETIGRSLAAALVLYALALLTLPLALDPASFHRFFSEQGPVEIASLILWPLAAVVVLASVRPHSRRTWAFALLYLVFAAREADLHKAFTAGSIFKSGYYRHVAAPLTDRYFTVFEEGIEAILPLLFGFSAWLEGRARSYL